MIIYNIILCDNSNHGVASLPPESQPPTIQRNEKNEQIE